MKEIVITAGFPASGKTSIIEKYLNAGYTQLSRDVEGGSISQMHYKLAKMVDQGVSNIVIDNTYVTKESRHEVILIAKVRGYRVVCIYLTTSIEDCMVNAVTRMIKRHGKILETPAELVNDPNAFPIAVLYKAKKTFEVPTVSEGFDEIITVPFKRTRDISYSNKAIIFDYDGTLRKTKSGAIFPVDPNDIEILPGRIEKLKELKAHGYILLGASNQSGVAKGQLTDAQAKACFDKTNELLGFDIDYMYCGHSVPPIVCYCRKPGVGIGITFLEKYHLDPSQVTMVGDMTSDETFAKRCGFKYVNEAKFF